MSGLAWLDFEKVNSPCTLQRILVQVPTRTLDLFEARIHEESLLIFYRTATGSFETPKEPKQAFSSLSQDANFPSHLSNWKRAIEPNRSHMASWLLATDCFNPLAEHRCRTRYVLSCQQQALIYIHQGPFNPSTQSLLNHHQPAFHASEPPQNAL